MMHGFGGYGGFGFMGIFNILIWVIVIVGIIYFIFAIFRDFGSRRTEIKTVEPDKSLKILKERYAKGEITKEEFLEMKKDLEE